MHRPLIPVFLSYLIGLLLGYYLPLSQLILLASIITFLIFFISSAVLKKQLLSFYLSIVIFTLLGILFLNSSLYPPLPPHHLTKYLSEKKVILEGVLYQPPELSADKTKLYLIAEKIIDRDTIININGYLLIVVKDVLNYLSYGDRVRFAARIRSPGNFNNPGGFDYRSYLARKGILATAYVHEGKAIVKVGETTLNPSIKRVEQCRSQIRIFLTLHLSSPAREITKALILGEQGELSKDVREKFSIAGVVHILSISGSHIGMIALVFFFLIKNILRCSTRVMLLTNITKVSALITLIPVIIYCFIAGHGVATVRATIMVGSYLLALIIGREDDLWNTVALAAFLTLIVSPSSLFDISFQLSYVSVIAILYLTPRFSTYLFTPIKDPLEPPPPWWKKLLKKITLSLLVTASATIGTIPLVTYYFNRISPWGIFANMIIIPLVGVVIVPLELLACLLLFIYQPLAAFILRAMEPMIMVSISIVELFNKLPYAEYRTTTPTLFEITLFFLGVLLLTTIKKSKYTRYGLAVVALSFIFTQCFWYYQNNMRSLLRITSIDVGQGESTLIQLPKGRTMLIDGGGFYDTSFDVGERVVAPFLWGKKITQIDYLVLSHPHPDHLNGLLFVAKNFKVKEVWTNGETIDTETFKELEKTIAEKKIKRFIADREQSHLTIHGVTIEFLHPPKSPWHERGINLFSSTNNHSLVLRLTYRDISILFTGDLYQEGERELINLFPSLKSTILKVPHHGSATSSSPLFLEKVAPRIAIVSIGEKNLFHLPSRKVIERYQAQGCRIFRTDKDGAITIETDGSQVYCKTFLSRMRGKINL